MNKIYSDGYLMAGALYLVFALIILMAIEAGVSFEAYNYLPVFSFAGLLPFIFVGNSSHQFLPSRLFVLSICSFILARPLINLFQDVDLVEVGNGINNNNIFKTLLIISIFIWISGIAFILGNNVLRVLVSSGRIYFGSKIRFPSLIVFKNFFFASFVFLGIVFLLKSADAAAMMSGVDYFTVVSDPEFHKHLFYFFLAKNLGLLWVFVTRSAGAVKLYAGLLLSFSIGFLLIGLRGYFMAYLFIYLYLHYEKRKINILMLASLAIAILYISSLVLEYRLGYEIFDDKVSMFTSPFYQQGATFEVIFGSVSFPEKLSQCISLEEYILGEKRFGDCVDFVRGVPFVEGGFASSILAEAYYFGLVPFLIISVIVGFAVALLNKLSDISVNSNNAFIAKLVILATLPNLVYIGRSGAFDFIVKLLAMLIIIRLFYVYRKY